MGKKHGIGSMKSWISSTKDGDEEYKYCTTSEGRILQADIWSNRTEGKLSALSCPTIMLEEDSFSHLD